MVPFGWDDALKRLMTLGERLGYPRLTDSDQLLAEAGHAHWSHGLAKLKVDELRRACGLVEKRVGRVVGGRA